MSDYNNQDVTSVHTFDSDETISIHSTNNEIDNANIDVNELNNPNSLNHNNDFVKIQNSVFSFTKNQYHETKLLHILNQANVPHFIYQDILHWAKKPMKMDTILIQKEQKGNPKFCFYKNGKV